MNTRWPRSSLACQPTPLAERTNGRLGVRLPPCVPASLRTCVPVAPRGRERAQTARYRRLVAWSLGSRVAVIISWDLEAGAVDIIMTFEPSGAGQTLADVRLPYSHESRQVDSAQAAPSRAPSTRRGLRVCGLAAGAGAGSRQTARGGPVPGRDSETAAVCRSSPLRLSGSLRVGARRSSYEKTGCTVWAGRWQWGCEDHAPVAYDRLLPWPWLVMWMGDWLRVGGKAGEYPYSMFA